MLTATIFITTSSLGSQTLEFVHMGIDASLQASLHSMLVWKQLLQLLKNLRKKKPQSTTDQVLVHLVSLEEGNDSGHGTRQQQKE